MSEALRRSADIGFLFVDISFHFLRYEGKVYDNLKKLAPNYRQGIKDLLRQLGLRVGAVLLTPHTLTRGLLDSVEIEHVAEASDFSGQQTFSLVFIMKQAIEAAKGIDAKLVDEFYSELPHRWGVYEEVKPILKAAEKENLKAGVENKNEISADQVLAVLSELGSSNLGVPFDELTRDNKKVVRMISDLGKTIVQTHIHCFSDLKSHGYAGYGYIDWIK